MKKYFAIIQEEIDKTIAVMKGLSDLEKIETKKYIESGTIMMIDLKKQIQEQLKKLDTIQDMNQH